ncbi:hydrolase CocE/NonD family protein [Alkalidesulfovibrio alkalitolerans DSM 16529]|uniref:Hydrolase CocE/NonD family protein n=1 Tax=Alkalidesulfovibrio alkalitolerans DSM 16529 TaxID=1121439 RepID=S7UEH2_9BACT|nr:CocE/NonD family hydrolase [Alkalidesulfovibrio alkalitolerans]EPR30638.1 hydrolase CocE/NonD family protein [Alkalidesulfovibrio alkalitolerans DSM 16529]
MIRRIRLRHVLAALAILLVSIALAGWLILSPEKVDTLAPGEARELEAVFGGSAAHLPVPRFDGVDLQSVSLVMRDGVSIALDVWLPRGLGTETAPALLFPTRYWRRADMLWPLDDLFGLDDDVRFFTAHGYAVVRMDVRGSGASGGSRPYPWAPAEREDLREVITWMAGQPWSNGRVAAMGVSYVGTAAEFAAGLGHPALRAVLPMFSLYDVYTDIAFPGGVRNDWFVFRWGRFNQALDANRLPDSAPWWLKQVLRGVAPVGEGETAREALARNVAQHAKNGDIHADALSVTFRDDVAPAPGVSTDAFSPHAFVDDMRATATPFYAWGGWHDGAYAASALARAKALGGLVRTVIGPWNHGAEQMSDLITGADSLPPSRRVRLYEQLRFLEHHLRDNGPRPESGVIYHVMGHEVDGGGWRRTGVWPPQGISSRTFHLDSGGRLSGEAPEEESSIVHAVDFSVGSGGANRWRTQLNRSNVAYPGREDAARLVVFDSEPLDAPLVIVGEAVAYLRLAADREDAAVHVYLEAVAPSGKAAMLTEGVLRALHRHQGSEAGRTFLRAHGSPLVPGEVADMVVPLLPTAVAVPKGWRIRLALAGADADQFVRIPREGGVNWTLYLGGASPARLTLPVEGG